MQKQNIPSLLYESVHVPKTGVGKSLLANSCNTFRNYQVPYSCIQEGIRVYVFYAFFKNHLWLDATVTYSHASRADIDFSTPQQTSNTYASEVLIPDMAYYSADYWRGQLSLKYEFPFSLKGSRSTAFVKAYADGIKADDDLDRTTVGLSFGLYY